VFPVGVCLPREFPLLLCSLAQALAADGNQNRLLGPWDRVPCARPWRSARLGMISGRRDQSLVLCGRQPCGQPPLRRRQPSRCPPLPRGRGSTVSCMVTLQPAAWSLSIFSTMCLMMYCPDDFRGSWQACIAAWLSVKITALGFASEKTPW
jgi:hypothetical protein